MPLFLGACLSLLPLLLGCNRTSIDTHVPVRGLSLHIVCRGKGHPPVILDAGLGNDSRIWSSVMSDIADGTQVCAYDRAGEGSSTPAPRPHSNQQMADELYDLLHAAKIPGPYVVVGHSMGGANVRLLHARHPKEVVGMVLIDSVSEHQPARFWALVPEEALSEFRKGLGEHPEGIDFETFRNGLERLGEVNPSLGALPLAHGKSPGPPPGATPAQERRLEAAWRSMQDDLARLSTHSAYRVVDDATHFIQLDRPDVVVAAVDEVVDAVRHHRPVDGNAIPVQAD